MKVGTIDKEPSEKMVIGVNYELWIQDGDYLTGGSVTASLEDNPASDQTSVLINKGGSPPDVDLIEGEAASGSTTNLVDGSTPTVRSFAASGVTPGKKFLNLTKLWTAIVKTVEETSDGWSEITFETQPRAVEAGDEYKFLFATIPIKAGVSGQNYRVTFKVQTFKGMEFEDEIFVNVRDL